MSISVTCQCGVRFRAKDDLAGKQAKCPKCGQTLTIPVPEGSEGAGGALSLDELMKLEAAGTSLQDQGMPAGQPTAGPGPQAQLPQTGGRFQSPQFGQPAAPSETSSGSNKGFAVALWCVGGFLLLAVVAVVLMFVFRGEKDPGPAASNDTGSSQKTDDEKSSSTPIILATLSPVTLDPGSKTAVEVQVKRNGNAGPIQIQFGDLPEGITVVAQEIPEGESVGQVVVQASEKLGDEEFQASLQITAKVGTVEASQSLALTVHKLSLPSFRPASAVVLQPGTNAAVRVAIERNGYEGPLELRVEGLPAKVTGKVGNIDAKQNETQLQITAAADAAEGNATVRAVASLYGRTIQVQIPLRIVKTPFVFTSLRVVTLEPGQEKRVQISVTRRSYSGPIRFEMANLPQGVTVAQVEIPPAQSAVTLVLSAAKDAKEHVRSSRVIATAGALRNSDYLIVRVARGEGGLLTKEVADDPELSGLLRRGGFGGRLTTKIKQVLLDLYGGTPESESAVFKGLAWLAAHQQRDGSWPLKAYNADIADCDCCTKFEGKVTDSKTAGTAFGLLPFLGAGIGPSRAPKNPPELAKYQKNVRKAITFLVRNQTVSRDAKSGKLDGNMYAHAIGTMALCEAYGLASEENEKEKLKIPTQLAIKYLVAGQHLKGGWRYGPNQAGDMSVTGWIFLAIRDGQLAGLHIRKTPLLRAERFVNTCEAGPEGAKRSQYSYTPGQPAKLTMTAAGLLTRQYLGWRRQRPDLLAGAQHLMKHRPPKSASRLGSIYYHYYATQVLHHMGGEDFDLWNHLMREHLIRTQERSGHQAGSWNPQGTDFGARGGRLYATSMALMTLQVYYRHLPLFGPALRKTKKKD